ncbi:autotransporter outer membrane beta-barrel domain-containing protein [Pseudomonas gingeri]|uniref:Autotransporter outer membrane beta-barrel domain-containing protein n=1 Tax=Pseudomonas gingeri TaxID=117681 RepID=A0A7Y8CJI2_9PSED|nr:autotransporter outer membrane beta-barrel domain-containing protein [Pseudomonas gingeri]NWB31559.1 autotransporter outer membrane beta-barrel domain-containing protein [Pseudomonas gingeri]NWC33051.1 autotransporter outer membrane beta-barrel domain-containing protein [Pseudomonas gingeri]NWD07987.1 autotransporter outer membrane beta-barrel domain-containing protein [Pseudomonas gingeri]NWD52100.1 autotransporter outer membrane beta-barrel domain-containing protein [Pseudomonas gingeri]N
MFNSKVLSVQYSKLSAAVKVAALAPLWLLSEQALAAVVTVDNRTQNVTTSNSNQYRVVNGGTLNVDGATVRDIDATGSTVNLTNANATALGNTVAVRLSNSQGTISGANITSAQNDGLQLVRAPATTTGSTATVSNSRISGLNSGVHITAFSVLDLIGSTVTATSATGQGINLLGGHVNASGSTITGGTNGVRLLREGTAADQEPHLSLDNTHVVGLSGAALLVDRNAVAEIDVNNGSTLTGGNGNMLELVGGGSANMRVSNSALTGNIQVGNASTLDLSLDGASMTGDVVKDAGGTAHVALNNGSVLTGRLDNVDTLALNSDATWVMTDHQSIGDLNMAGGNVKFGDPGAFYQLDVENLAGNGTFIMTADFAHLQGDFLNVTGTSEGEHKLLISSSGADPLSEDRLHVVRTADGGATFSLLGDRVDVGTYSYSLIADDDGKDWHLDPSTKVISPGTRSVLALANVAPTVMYGELTSLRSRMGELRFNGGQSGGWMRTYGNKHKVDAGKGGAYDQIQQGLSLGADGRLPVGDGQWLAGVMAGYSKSDLSLGRGTHGTVHSTYIGGYATWLDEQSGYYFDGVAKLNSFHNKASVALSDGQKAKGNYKDLGASVSGEFGKHIKLDNDYFVEPAVQVTAMAIGAKDYKLDNGLKAETGRTLSLLGKVGVTGGRNFDIGDGRVAQPYLRTAFVQEFAKNNKVQVNDNSFHNDLSGSRVELGTGVAVSLNEKWQVHADLDFSKGEKIDQPWGANVGIRYSW